MNGSNHQHFSEMHNEPDEIDAGEEREERPWCVEKGATLAALSTSDLLQAISAGEISATSRVWCEGLEGWTRISDVPEIACLFGGFEAELATLPAVEMAPPSGFAPRAHTPAPLDLSQLDTPSAVPVARPVRSSEGFGSRANSASSNGKAARLEGDDARWIGGGLLVAAAAIGMALFQSAQSAPRTALAYAEHQLAAVESAALEAAAALPPLVDRATLSRSEPGQRRQRGGAGRPNRR
jgi:hypothetical protein